MKKICALGKKISNPDQKALDHYLLVTPKTWASDALKGMVNKAVKTLMRDWFETFKSKQLESVPADYSDIIPGIIAMTEFKPYNHKTPEVPMVQRDANCDIEIWQGGFDIEDYEKQALEAFYEDPEAYLYYLIENKVDLRKKAFIKEHEAELIKDKSVTSIPKRHDALINMITAKPTYKNRVVREAEIKTQRNL